MAEEKIKAEKLFDEIITNQKIKKVSSSQFRNGQYRSAILDGMIQLEQMIKEKITFHTFRHFGATMLYAKTKNLIYVQEKLGHRNIQNTMVYTHLINFESDEYHSQHAKTLAEEDKLIEAGFEFVRYDTREDVAIYRKRK